MEESSDASGEAGTGPFREKGHLRDEGAQGAQN